MSKVQVVSLTLVRENPVALRAVDTSSEAFLGLVDSIKAGFMGAITVREKIEPGTGLQYFEILDGLHRTTAARIVGMTEIPVSISTKSDEETLEAQITMNLHKVDTKPAEYAKQLKRILTMNPAMTEGELAVKVCKSATWIRDRLSLNSIVSQHTLELINEGKIPLMNAYALSKLPEEEQDAFVSRAMTEDAKTFTPAVHARIKEIRDAAKKGGEAGVVAFEPVAHLRKMSDIKAASDDASLASRIVAVNGVSDVAEAFQLALKWVLHMDTEAIVQAKAKDEARKADEAAAKVRRASEREAKKSAEAAAATAG